MSTFVKLIEATRGPLAETVHCGIVVLCNADGKIIAGAGDPTVPIFPRSALKPLQALPFLESGAFDALRLEPQHVALVCASHSGSPRHIGIVREILDRSGCTSADLGCGAHPPIGGPSEVCSALHHNCSGKHAGFLAVCRHRGWPLGDYLAQQHPVQELVREAIHHIAAPGVLLAAIDGCSAPTYALPLDSLATAYARLGAASDTTPAGKIRLAMQNFPELISGEERFELALVRACRGRIIAKSGAEGVMAVAIPERQLGFAVKIHDGSASAAQVATAALLTQLNLLDPAGLKREWQPGPQKNAAGIVTGEVRATFRLG